MAYARYSKSSKRTWSKRRSARGRRRYSGYGNRKASKPKFATVGFARNVEKKYFDKTYQSNNLEVATGNSTSVINNGVAYVSNVWGNYAFGTQAGSSVVSNDMFKGLDTGTTARTRIGNKIRPVYVKGAFTFNAALVNTATTKTQNGEALEQPTAAVTQQYLRTSYRFVIVKDLQVNSTDTQVTWSQVFDTTGLQAGVHWN